MNRPPRAVFVDLSSFSLALAMTAGCASTPSGHPIETTRGATTTPTYTQGNSGATGTDVTGNGSSHGSGTQSPKSTAATH